MKRRKAFLLCVAVFLLTFGLIFTGCTAEKTAQRTNVGGVFAFCGGDLEKFAETFDANEMDCLEYRYTEDTPITCRVTDKEKIKTIFDALLNIEVGAENDMRATDSEASLTFVKTDGTAYTVTFEQQDLISGGKAYVLQNDAALWKALRKAK